MSEPTAKEILAEIDRTIESMAAFCNIMQPTATITKTAQVSKQTLLTLAEWIKARMDK